MTDTSDSEPTTHRTDDSPRTSHDRGHVEAIPDTESETVTFAWKRPEDGETTTAWITVDAATVVNGPEMQ